MTTPEKKIPALRFPEFQDEWDIKKVSQFLRRVVKPVKVEEDYLYQQIGIRSHGRGLFHKELVTGKEIGSKRVFWVQESTFIVNIVFAWEQAVAKTTHQEVGMIASHRFPMYRPIKGISDLDYILYFFLTEKGKHLLGLASPGGAGRNKTLGQKEFEKLKIILPTQPEQKKIAAFLTAIDARISHLEQKKTLLEQYKKGVMQRIFSQELRFKDENGKEFQAWEVKRIDKIFKVTRGKVLAASLTKEKSESEYCYPVYSSQTKNYGLMGYYNEYLYENALTWTTDGANAGEVNLREGKFYCTNVCGVLLSDKGYANKCVAEIINSVSRRYVSYVGNPKLMNNVMSSIKIMVPSLPEQQKIAEFLSAIDDKINLVADQIEKTKTYKKGLLQQMFI